MVSGGSNSLWSPSKKVVDPTANNDGSADHAGAFICHVIEALSRSVRCVDQTLSGLSNRSECLHNTALALYGQAARAISIG